MVGKLKFLLACLLCLPLIGAWPNTGKKYPPGGAVAYAGPGDVLSGAILWYGVRAYTAALANAGASTTKVIDVLGSTTVTGCTIFLKGNGTGGLDLTTSGAGGVGNQCSSGATTFCTVTNTSCTVSKFYDQTGALKCTGIIACNVIQPTAANQPTVVFNCIGSSPCLKKTVSATQLSNSGGLTAGLSQPVSMSTVTNMTVTGQPGAPIFAAVAGDAEVYFNTGTTATIYAGAGPLAAAYTTNTGAARNDVANNTSCIINLNGTETTGSCGTGGITTGGTLFLFIDGFGGNIGTGLDIAEAGLWSGGFSGANRTALCQNQQAYYGSGNFGAVC